MEDISEWLNENIKKTKGGEEWVKADDMKSYLSYIDDELTQIEQDLECASLENVVDILSNARSSLSSLAGEIYE